MKTVISIKISEYYLKMLKEKGFVVSKFINNALADLELEDLFSDNYNNIKHNNYVYTSISIDKELKINKIDNYIKELPYNSTMIIETAINKYIKTMGIRL